MAQRTYYSEEARIQARRNRNALVSIALMVGAGLGALLTYLFTTDSGHAVWNKLESAAEDRRDQIKDGVGNMKKMVS